MKIKPIGNRMVLDISKSHEKEISGIVIIENEKDEQNFGKIIALSEELNNSDNFLIGDKVIYKEFKGKTIKTDDQELLIIDAEDVLGIIE